jgi:uncharacterized membrane protein
MLALALAGAELGILLGPAPIRVPAGLIVAFLPGLAITRAIQTRTRIEGTEQLLLVPGISLAVAVITGLVLNSADVRLTAGNWAIALGLATAAGVAAEAMLKQEHEVTRPRRRHGRLTAASRRGRSTLDVASAAMFVIAALVVSAAVASGVRAQRDRDIQTGFTQLWAVPEPGSPSAVRVGVRSHERGDARYRIRVSIEGRVVRSQALTLRPGQTWRSTQPVARSGQRVDVVLLTSPRAPAYREVHVTAE